MLLTRREWTFTVAGSLMAVPPAGLAAQPRSVVGGVRIGAQTYTFRDRPLEKDRRRDQAAGVPFGRRDAPIVAVLQRLGDRKWDIPAHTEFDYRPADVVAEVISCLDYCRKALEA